MPEKKSFGNKAASSFFRTLAKAFINLKRPLVVCVAGSVGKTSTKLALKHLLSSEKKISAMDDSYNNGLGLYLSVFEQKVPKNSRSLLAWAGLSLKALSKFFVKSPEIIILEYGIDSPGDMDNMIKFITPDVSILTAVTPEHMEFLKDIDTVGQEETKILRHAKKFAVANAHDIDYKYLDGIKFIGYGDDFSDARYKIVKWARDGTVVDFSIEDWQMSKVHVNYISEALIRQLSGAALVSKRLGISKQSVERSLSSLEPAASRMHIFKGINDSVIIDDSTNFSPDAGVEALKSLKRLEAKKHIAILGNMHELGEFANEGYEQVASEFNGVDALVLVGELSRQYFTPLAEKFGFKINSNLFLFDDSIDAGIFTRDKLGLEEAAILVKGPFGGFYLEEAVKLLLKNPKDGDKLTRQSEFWLDKKRQHFGEKFNY